MIPDLNEKIERSKVIKALLKQWITRQGIAGKAEIVLSKNPDINIKLPKPIRSYRIP